MKEKQMTAQTIQNRQLMFAMPIGVTWTTV